MGQSVDSHGELHISIRSTRHDDRAGARVPEPMAWTSTPVRSENLRGVPFRLDARKVFESILFCAIIALLGNSAFRPAKSVGGSPRTKNSAKPAHHSCAVFGSSLPNGDRCGRCAIRRHDAETRVDRSFRIRTPGGRATPSHYVVERARARSLLQRCGEKAVPAVVNIFTSKEIKTPRIRFSTTLSSGVFSGIVSKRNRSARQASARA